MDALKAAIAAKRAEQRAAQAAVGERYASRAALKAAKRSRNAAQGDLPPTLPASASILPDDTSPASKRTAQLEHTRDTSTPTSSSSASASTAGSGMRAAGLASNSSPPSGHSSSTPSEISVAAQHSSSVSSAAIPTPASSSSSSASAASASASSSEPPRRSKPPATASIAKRTVRSCMKLNLAEFEDDASELVYKFFRRLLVEWNQAAESREATARLPRATPAQAEAAARERHVLEQAAEFVRPLLHKAKYSKLDKDLLEHVRKIVGKALERRFREAGEHYMELAIGNSPWPIGVGSFGIHERASRTKIRSENIANLMNSEEHRRGITALKALLTKCQVLYPPDLASELFH